MDAIELLVDAQRIARQAGKVILEIYQSGDFEQYTKSNDTPVTSADLAAHELIQRELGALTPDIPILSEEQAEIALSLRKTWPRYWLVDPLDGTQEFVSGSGDFATIIALIENHKPVLGVVYAPVSDVLYDAVKGHGAFKEVGGERIAIHAMHHDETPTTIAVAISRVQSLSRIRAALNPKFNYQLVPMGSASLKSCLVAEGAVDCYVRLGPTGEWDIGGPQIILQEAGGDLLDLALVPLSYNRRETLENPNFISLGDPELAWASILTASAG
jgi:3'(2'), 5'-bisphosphate nucleotidase